jgi:hypothetical protein
MSVQSEMDADPKEKGVRVLRAGLVTFLIAVLVIVFVAGVFWYQGITSLPSVNRQSEEVAALETHVLPLVKDLRATWYLNERFGSGSMYWKRGNFTKDPARARQDGDDLFDKETEESFEQLSQAIRASGVPTNRLCGAKFADDGTLSTASFQRRGGGLEYIFTYIYSPGAKPEEWTSNLGPVVLTRIGVSDWWFEQSPND